MDLSNMTLHVGAVPVGAAFLGSIPVWTSAPAAPAATVAALPATGVRSFHRGSGNPAMRPEAGARAIDYALTGVPGFPAHVMDVDMQRTSDGVLVALHDTTVDYATAGTGAVSSFTYATLPALHMPEVVGSYYGPEPVLRIDQDILQQYGGRVVLNFEPKSAADAQPLVDLIKQRGLQASCVINSKDPAVVKVATDQGIPGWVWNVNTNALADAAVAAAPTFMEVNDPAMWTQTFVNYVKSKGARFVTQGPTKDRYSYALGLSLGFHGCTIDAPGYILGPVENKANIADEIAQQRVGEGWWGKPFSTTGQYSFPVFKSDGVILSRGATTQTSADSSFQRRRNWRFGTLCGPKPSVYAWRERIRYDVVPAANSSTTLVVCAVDDRGTGETDAPGQANSYSATMRSNGNLEVYKTTNNAGTMVAQVMTAPITAAGTVVDIRVNVDTTGITVTRLDTGNAAHTVRYNDTAYRGNYHWVKGNTYGYETTLLSLEWGTTV